MLLASLLLKGSARPLSQCESSLCGYNPLSNWLLKIHANHHLAELSGLWPLRLNWLAISIYWVLRAIRAYNDTWLVIVLPNKIFLNATREASLHSSSQLDQIWQILRVINVVLLFQRIYHPCAWVLILQLEMLSLLLKPPEVEDVHFLLGQEFILALHSRRGFSKEVCHPTSADTTTLNLPRLLISEFNLQSLHFILNSGMLGSECP